MAHAKTTSAILELSLPASVSSIREFRVAAAEAVAELGLDGRLVDDIRLCVSEAVTNVVRYAYGVEPGTVDLGVKREGDELVVAVRDAGTGIGSATRQPSRPGGLGLMIIDKLTSRHTIASAWEAGTEVRMFFALEVQPSHDGRER